MTTSDKVRSVRRLTRRDRKLEELLGRTVSLFQKGTQRRQLETIQKKSQLIASPEQPEENGFNQKAVIPFGLSAGHIYKSMMDFTNFMGFIDTELRSQEMARFEDILTAPNFNSMVREFMSTTIPKYCKTVMKNRQYNGHPDIVRAGMYSNDSIGDAGGNGIEVRASRYLKNWQGHPDEKSWLMIFVFQSGRLNPKVTEHVRFKFLLVAGGLLSKDDWLNAGYPEISRTGNTQTITRVGAQKIMTNWIYKCKELRESRADFTHNLLSNEQAWSSVGISHIFKAEEDLVEQRFNSIEKGLARALLLLAEHGKEPDLETKILSITARSSGNALGGIHLATWASAGRRCLAAMEAMHELTASGGRLEIQEMLPLARVFQDSRLPGRSARRHRTHTEPA